MKNQVAPPRNLVAEKMTEEKLQRCILELANVCGWLAYHTHDSRRSPKGFPGSLHGAQIL